MLTNLEELSRYHFVQNGLSDDTEEGLDLFREILLEMATQYRGHEFVEAYGLENHGKLTRDQAMKLLDDIKSSLDTDKSDIVIKMIDQVPEYLNKKLCQTVGWYTNNVRNAEIRYWVMRWKEVVWFVSWTKWELWINIEWIYVDEDYRGNMYSHNLMLAMYEELKKTWLKRLDIDNASIWWEIVLKRFAKYLSQQWVECKLLNLSDEWDSSSFAIKFE